MVIFLFLSCILNFCYILTSFLLYDSSFYLEFIFSLKIVEVEELSSFAAEGGVVLHVVTHSHWDREWYLPFESFRGRLIHTLDVVLDQFYRRNDTSFKHFHLDGQMIPVDDYLEIRDQKRQEIYQANVDGKLALGPWYVISD